MEWVGRIIGIAPESSQADVRSAGFVIENEGSIL
jgi:hypothetical protein